MKKNCTIGFLMSLLLLVLVFTHVDWSSVLGARREPGEGEEEVEAYYYTNLTGKSSKYISYAECNEIGRGTIIISVDAGNFAVRNSPDEVSYYLNEIPYYSSNLDITWMTIYRSHNVYRVIGEVAEREALDDGGYLSSSEPDYYEDYDDSSSSELLILDDETFEDTEDDELLSEDLLPEEEIIIEETKIPDEYDTISDLISSEVTSGMSVNILGYYSINDGGDGTYIISETPGKIYEKLDNGLFANLQYDDSINIKLLGAKGNGSDDDSAFLVKALSLGVSEVTIPEGNYNLSNKAISVPKGVSITGIDRDSCVLKNLNLTAPSGIKLSNLTCEGGTKKRLTTPGEVLSNTVMIDASPKGSQSVSYTNCVFKNTDFASFAFASTEGRFSRDEVSDCIFENIGRVAVYHSTNSDYTSYKNNSFSEIGNTSITYGPVSAIWIGDVTNNTYTKSKQIYIDNNSFDNLYTEDDFTSVHSLNANFICIRGDKAVVSNNHVKNLFGYGSDREAVYTKVSDLTINNNEIINGGHGEGYICNKGVEGKLYATITNNTISGDYGTGIRQYGPASIRNNDIQIKYCPDAILMTSRGDQTDTSAVEISGNIISSGIDGKYYYNGKEVANYSADKVINIIGTLGATTVSGNKIYPGTAYSAYIAVGNARGDITIDGNEIDSRGKKGSSISVYNNSNGKVNSKQSIVFSKNNLSVESGQKSISVNFVSQNTKRTFLLEGNNYTFTNATAWNYPLSIIINGTNNDTLKVSGNTTNSTLKRTSISYSPKTFVNNDENFATYSKR